MNDYFSHRVRKLIGIMMTASVIGLLCTPLFPWITIDYDGDNSYLPTGYLTQDDSDWDGSDNLNWISWSFWLAIIFGIAALLGFALYHIGRYRVFGHILLLSGCIIVLFGILNIVNHVWLIGEINDLSGDAFYFFNYIPLIMGIILLVASIGYVILVLPASMHAFASLPGRTSGYHRPPTQHEPTEGEKAEVEWESSGGRITIQCPECGNTWSMEKPDEPVTVFCPSCGKKGRIK